MRNVSSPTEEELRQLAYDATSVEPTTEWDTVLSWRMERGVLSRYVEYASDPECPKSGFFIDVLFRWVETVACDDQFNVLRSMYDDWLEVARGVTDPRVKTWRHEARLMFQGLKLSNEANGKNFGWRKPDMCSCFHVGLTPLTPRRSPEKIRIGASC